MKTRLLSTFVLTVALAFSIAVASEKGEKTTKSTTAKKEVKGCCSEGMKSAKGCSEKDMKNCDAKEAKASMKSKDAKVETKTQSTETKKD